MKYVPAGTRIEGPDGMGYDVLGEVSLNCTNLKSADYRPFGGAPIPESGRVPPKWLRDGLKEKAIERD